MADKPSYADRLKARVNELRETRAILAKRDKRVKNRWEQQKQARKNLEAAIKRKAPRRKIDDLEEDLAVAHEMLDKAILGQKEYAAREKRLEKKVQFLKDHKPQPPPTPGGFSVPNTAWNPYKRPISNSLVPWLQKTWDSGTHFYVTSGYRSPAYQCEICKQVCGVCGGCPGRCAAPGTSNHGRYGPGQGAVDVTNYYAFKAAQYRIGSPLRNYLGSADPVHFSFTGR